MKVFAYSLNLVGYPLKINFFARDVNLNPGSITTIDKKTWEMTCLFVTVIFVLTGQNIELVLSDNSNTGNFSYFSFISTSFSYSTYPKMLLTKFYSLNTDMDSGMDQFPAKFLKVAAYLSACSLFKIINLSEKLPVFTEDC